MDLQKGCSLYKEVDLFLNRSSVEASSAKGPTADDLGVIVE